MSPEEIWQACPLDLKNVALSIAREYDHGWGFSEAVPPALYFWELDEEIPSLKEIEEKTPEGPLGKGIVGPNISFDGSQYILQHRTGTGRVFIEVLANPEISPCFSYKVVISRPNGDNAVGIRDGQRAKDGIQVTATQSTWGVRHENAWKKAWRAIGVPAPEFPSKLPNNKLIVEGDGLKDDPLDCNVVILPGAVLSTEDLMHLQEATSVEFLDKAGHTYSVKIEKVSDWPVL